MAVTQAPPDWLAGLLRCPHDGGRLVFEDGRYRCEICDRGFPFEEGIVRLLPDDLVHLGRGVAAGTSDDQIVEWVEGEMAWWDGYQATDSGEPMRPDRGMRGRSREENLFAHVRDRVGSEPVVIEMGAGSSRTVAGLWPPAQAGLRYVATDISRPWLRAGEAVRGGAGAAVQCEAGSWPFGRDIADAVVVLGVLHHVPDWRRALRSACESVRPGGFMLLHEVVWKPQIFAARRKAGVNDAWTSPHEGHVLAHDLRECLEERGDILRWRGEATPLRFALVQYLDLHERMERSRRLTGAIDRVDQAFGRSFGRLRPSLGFAEVTCLWQRAQPGA